MDQRAAVNRSAREHGGIPNADSVVEANPGTDAYIRPNCAMGADHRTRIDQNLNFGKLKKGCFVFCEQEWTEISVSVVSVSFISEFFFISASVF